MPGADLDALLDDVAAALDASIPPVALQSPGTSAVAPATPQTTAQTDTQEIPPLPQQWDRLLGSSPEQAPAARPSDSVPDAAPVPPEFREQMEQMAKQMPDLQQQLDRVEKRLEQPVPPEFREQMEHMAKQMPDLQNQLDRMEKQMMELSAGITASAAALEKRLDHLETRLDTIKTDAKEDLDRAAASAAARILREELAAILTEETK